jgi:hypothetical protein
MDVSTITREILLRANVFVWVVSIVWECRLAVHGTANGTSEPTSCPSASADVGHIIQCQANMSTVTNVSIVNCYRKVSAIAT